MEGNTYMKYSLFFLFAYFFIQLYQQMLFVDLTINKVYK